MNPEYFISRSSKRLESIGVVMSSVASKSDLIRHNDAIELVALVSKGAEMPVDDCFVKLLESAGFDAVRFSSEEVALDSGDSDLSVSDDFNMFNTKKM